MEKQRRMDSRISNIIQDFVSDSQKILKENLIAEYLFGSYARNEQTELSDIDILVIVRNYNWQMSEELSSLSSDYSLDYGVIISPVLTDIAIWKKNKKHNTLFYKEVKGQGVKLC